MQLMITTLGHVVDALNSLGQGFKEFTTSIRARDTPFLFDELFDKLVHYEIFLQPEECCANSVSLTANHARWCLS